MRSDGNLVVYDGQGKTVWSSKTNQRGNKPYSYVMQSDGNLVVYGHKKALWSSKTKGMGTGPYTLTVQNDCSLVVSDSTNKSLWSSVPSA